MAIRWMPGIKVAAAKAREMNWNLFLYFFSPDSDSCKALDDRTFSDGRVQGELAKDFIPTRVDRTIAKDLAVKCRVAWTPTIIFLDSNGREYHRVVGFLPGDDLIGHIYIGRGRIAFGKEIWDKAMSAFKHVVDRHPMYDLGAEAQYWYAAAKYNRQGKDATVLRKNYQLLRNKFPDSAWTRRTLFMG